MNECINGFIDEWDYECERNEGRMSEQMNEWTCRWDKWMYEEDEKRAPVWTDKCPIKLCSKHILKFKLPGSERQHSCFT